MYYLPHNAQFSCPAKRKYEATCERTLPPTFRGCFLLYAVLCSFSTTGLVESPASIHHFLALQGDMGTLDPKFFQKNQQKNMDFYRAARSENLFFSGPFGRTEVLERSTKFSLFSEIVAQTCYLYM